MKTRLNTPKTLRRFLPLIVFLSICCASALSLFVSRLDARPSLASLGSHTGPTGLTVVRNGEYNNVVSWHAVPGAISYHLQHRSLYPANLWTNVPGCDPTSTTCTDITGTTGGYAYRVQASNGRATTDWSNIAVFLSEPDQDGYVAGPPFNINSAVPNDAQPGVRAGQKRGAMQPGPDLRGFLSFNTSALGSTTTVLGAKLRLRQATSNDAFELLGPCMVDVQRGAFSVNPALEIADFFYTDTNTTVDAFEIIGVGADEWFEAVVGGSNQVNNADHTQFRIYFDHSSAINEYAGWYSGESDDSPPQLLVRYTE
jgi:hypothetical protein